MQEFWVIDVTAGDAVLPHAVAIHGPLDFHDSECNGIWNRVILVLFMWPHASFLLSIDFTMYGSTYLWIITYITKVLGCLWLKGDTVHVVGFMVLGSWMAAIDRPSIHQSIPACCWGFCVTTPPCHSLGLHHRLRRWGLAGTWWLSLAGRRSVSVGIFWDRNCFFKADGTA